MTDYFALFGHPRSPWLDTEELKRAFHNKTLSEHPDAQWRAPDRSDAEASFSELNEAYQVLRDPARRLKHLLGLEKISLPRSDAIPDEIEALFPAVATLMERADALARRAGAATTALNRSLVKRDSVTALHAIDGMLQQVRELHEDATRALAETKQRWATDPKAELPALHRLYLKFSYLARWITELEEKRARLATLP